MPLAPSPPVLGSLLYPVLWFRCTVMSLVLVPLDLYGPHLFLCTCTVPFVFFGLPRSVCWSVLFQSLGRKSWRGACFFSFYPELRLDMSTFVSPKPPFSNRALAQFLWLFLSLLFPHLVFVRISRVVLTNRGQVSSPLMLFGDCLVPPHFSSLRFWALLSR